MKYIAILAFLFACERIADNPVEETIEDVILEKTGVSVDLTGHSEEKPNGD